MKIRLTNVFFISFWSFSVAFEIKKKLLELIMRTFLFLFCTTLFSLTPTSIFSQNDKININRDKVISVDEVFNIVRAQSDYMFAYEGSLFKDFPKVKLKKGSIRLNKLLNICVTSTDFSVIFTANNTILIKKKNGLTRQQELKVSGTITDPSGLPLPNVTVLIKGTNKGVSSNLDGQYTITVPDPANVLVFSSLGFETEEVTVGKQKVIDVLLKESISALDEVTINAGYYNTSEKERTGSISKIAAKDIEKQPVNNPLAAMQGHLSGVHITQSTGSQGGNYRIRIRGSNFLDLASIGAPLTNTEANNPLYIIDGVPYNTDTLAERDISSNSLTLAGVSPLNTINPGDIESIEVLKDADATAIYGSRGANGVVLITTKKGRVGKTQVKVNVSTGVGEVTRFPNLMNTQQYLEVRKEALSNDGYTLETILDVYPSFDDDNPDLYVWDQNRYTDWQEVLLGGTAFRQSAQIAFSGGSENTQFLLSGAHASTGNVFPGDFKYKNTSVHFNLTHKSEDNRFTLSTSVNYGADTNDLPFYDLTGDAVTLAPNAPALYDADGNLNWENSTWVNPFSKLEQKYNSATYSLIGNTTLSYRPIRSLELKANLGYTKNNLESYRINPTTNRDPNGDIYDSSSSFISTNEGTNTSWIVEPQINWENHWKDTSLKILLGASFQHRENQKLHLFAFDFPSDALLQNLTAARVRLIEEDTESEYKYHAVFGRLNFNVKDKYILNLTGRRDGSSRFGPGKQYGYFGAIGAAWLFSEEGFLIDNTVLSFGKLRGSYGLTGSDNVPDYAFYDTYQSSGGGYNGSGLRPTRLFNPDLAWGTNKKLEVALELGFFKDRVFMTAAWYRNRSSNQLANVSLPKTTGFSFINDNFDALVQNSGVEIDLRTKNIQNDTFKWNTTFNISANRNKLLAFPDLENTTSANYLIIGESLSFSRVYNYLGVDPDTGLWQFEDRNNDGVIQGFTANGDFGDRNLIVDFTPEFTGGLGNVFTYKSLQLDVFFQFTKQKGNGYLAAYGMALGEKDQNMPVSILDRWQQSGEQAPIQRYYVANSDAQDARARYLGSNATITDASFIRLRNVSLTYSLPKEVVKDLGVNIYFQGQNLFLITGYEGADPERPGTRALAPLRQFTLGLNVTF